MYVCVYTPLTIFTDSSSGNDGGVSERKPLSSSSSSGESSLVREENSFIPLLIIINYLILIICSDWLIKVVFIMYIPSLFLFYFPRSIKLHVRSVCVCGGSW